MAEKKQVYAELKEMDSLVGDHLEFLSRMPISEREKLLEKDKIVLRQLAELSRLTKGTAQAHIWQFLDLQRGFEIVLRALSYRGYSRRTEGYGSSRGRRTQRG
jgi:hypothetical protein